MPQPVMLKKQSWSIKKAECGRIDAFELWCWRRLSTAPWTLRRSNQSILKKSVLNSHWKDWSWSWNSSTLASWCKELNLWKRPWWWERLKAWGDDRGWDDWMASLTQWTWVWVNSRSWWWTRSPRGRKELDTTAWLICYIWNVIRSFQGGL